MSEKFRKPSSLAGAIKVEKTLMENYNARAKNLRDTFNKGRERFGGLKKSYEATREDESGTKSEPEVKEVETSVLSEFGWFRPFFVDYINMLMVKERTNQNAKVNLELFGVSFKDVPVVALIHLETALKNLKNSILQIPTLDGTKKWAPSDRGKGIYKSEQTTRTDRTIKSMEAKVLHEGNDKHPPQAQLIETTSIIGYYTTEHFSGAIPTDVKADMISRLDHAILTVATIKVEANRNQVTIVEEDFGALFDALLAPLYKSLQG